MEVVVVIGWMLGMALLVGQAQATHTVRIDYIEAADLAPPNGAQKILIIDPASMRVPPGQRSLVQAAVDRFVADGRKAVSPKVAFVSMRQGRGSTPDFDWDTLDALCKEHGAQAVVSLDNLVVRLDRPGMSTRTDTEERQGRVREVQVFVGSQKVTVDTEWTYWHPESRTEINHVERRSEWSTSTAEGRVRNGVTARVQDKVDQSLPVLGARSGAWYAQWVFAYRTTGVREIFANGKMRHGRKYTAVGKWTEARDEWRRIWENGKRSGRRARYNIAVSHEVQGHPRQALKTLDPLMGRWNKPLVKDYYRALKARVRNLEELQDQGLR